MEKVIIIVGPTAVGKTKISIDLAQNLNTEIISGDSMLVYRGLNIGTAKPSYQECCGITHHLIDILEPYEEYNVVTFQQQARQLISQINKSDKIPIVVGGTGLYVKSLLEDYDFSKSKENEALRQELSLLATTHGNNYVHNMLQKVLPETAARLHPNDMRRVIRALEVYQDSGETVSQSQNAPNLLYDACVIGLTTERQILYERINTRVDTMIANGLVEEVTGLLKSGIPPDCQAMQGIGYKETVKYLNGIWDLFTAINEIKKGTRHFAKRQLTWYRNMPYIKWITVDNPPDYFNIISGIEKILQECSVRNRNKH